MTYIGDIRLGDTFDVKFCTVTTTGAPTQLAGSPVISAYPGNSTTQLTAGITLTVDFDSVTGLNNVRVVATSGNGYATATNYALVITTGTVGGTSAVGYVVAQFSIENRSALMPTTATRTLDVSSTGEAGVDWGNVGSPTTTVDLSGTTIKTTQKVDVDTIKTNPVVNGGTITFPTTATLASTTNITAATGIDVTKLLGTAWATPATAGLTDVNVKQISTDGVAADNAESFFDGTGYAGTNNVIPSVTTVTGNVNGSVGSVTGAVGSVTGAIGSLGATAKSDVNGEVVDALNVDTYAEIGQETPAATQTLRKMLAYLYKAWRNKKTQTSTTFSLFNDDAATVDQKSTVSDDGTTFTDGEKTTGP